ncbi:hypothetical protein V6D52_09895 [Idiomarina loihiensis]|uniref:hypothetical protein n=1 Tax=Idiomarina loihiensis TaxID=135577 RepID=UPI0039BDACBD
MTPPDHNTDIVGKFIDVSLYRELAETIPDENLEIIEQIPQKDKEQIVNAYKPYLNGMELSPFAVTLGDNVLFTNSVGTVYYVDFDFGVFDMGRSLDEFVAELKNGL